MREKTLWEELENLAYELKRKNFKRVFIQFPEGLKHNLEEIKKIFKKYEIEVVFSLEPTYGACDVREEEALRLNCSAIVHIGHSIFIKNDRIPVFYVHYLFEADKDLVTNLLERNKNVFSHKSYVIVCSLQYIKYIKIVREFLEKLDKKVYTKKVLEYEGQILGCNVNAAKIEEAEAIIVISEGFFYPLGLLVEIEDKPIIYIDLEKQEIRDISFLREKYKKIIAWNFNKFKESKKVGLLVSWKKGQVFYDFFKIKEEIEKLGKEVYVFAFDEILPEKLEGINVDFLINLACPRIFPDDVERYKIPVLNYSLLKKLLYEEKRDRNNSIWLKKF